MKEPGPEQTEAFGKCPCPFPAGTCAKHVGAKGTDSSALKELMLKGAGGVEQMPLSRARTLPHQGPLGSREG